MSVDIVMFVEDPGAANYAMGLPPLFANLGLTTRLVSAGNATDYLHQRGIASETFTDSVLSSSTLSSLPNSTSIASIYHCRLALIGTSENPDASGLQFIKLCREAGVCSVGVVDAYANAAYRFRGRTQNPLAYAPDWLIVPDSITKDAYSALGYPVDHILIGGHPHYDTIRAERERIEKIGRATLRQQFFPDARPERPIVVFAAEISTGLEPAAFRRAPDYTLHGWGSHHGRTEIVLEEFLDAVSLLQPRPYLVLRLHPKNILKEFDNYLNSFNLVSQGGVPLELIYAADAVVGMSSMLLLEAALLGRPTLSILPRLCEKEWLPTTRTGLTPCATTRSETRSSVQTLMQNILAQILLQSSLTNTDIDTNIVSNVDKDIAAIETVMPTGSSKRIAAFVAGLLSSQH